MGIKNWFKDKLHEQTVDFSSVEPRMDFRDNTVFFNSCAGLLSYKAKTLKDLEAYRNKWANQFSLLLDAHHRGIDVKEQFFKLYNQIISSGVRVKYKANLRTRMRRRVCVFKDYL